jgi:hypothetical protein
LYRDFNPERFDNLEDYEKELIQNIIKRMWKSNIKKKI